MRLVLSAAALAITALGWLWFVMCFTATYAAWWNSLWVFVAAFGLASAIGVASFFSKGSSAAKGTSIAACVWASLSFAFVLIFVIL